MDLRLSPICFDSLASIYTSHFVSFLVKLFMRLPSRINVANRSQFSDSALVKATATAYM